jgi:site-specific recombinase XerD
VGTRQQYLASLRRFEERIGKSADQSTQEDIRRWVEFLQTQPIGPERLRCHYSALSFLFKKILGRPEVVAFISMPRKDAPLPVILTPQEVKRVLESFTVAKYGIFFSLIYATGLRINEARHLETQDIDALRGVIHVRHAKGGGQRMVMLSPKLLDQLRNYWKYDRPTPPLLFSTGKGQPLCPDTARRALLYASAMAGIGKIVTPHCLRHNAEPRFMPSGLLFPPGRLVLESNSRHKFGHPRPSRHGAGKEVVWEGPRNPGSNLWEGCGSILVPQQPSWIGLPSISSRVGTPLPRQRTCFSLLQASGAGSPPRALGWMLAVMIALSDFSLTAGNRATRNIVQQPTFGASWPSSERRAPSLRWLLAPHHPSIRSDRNGAFPLVRWLITCPSSGDSLPGDSRTDRSLSGSFEPWISTDS